MAGAQSEDENPKEQKTKGRDLFQDGQKDGYGSEDEYGDEDDDDSQDSDPEDDDAEFERDAYNKNNAFRQEVLSKSKGGRAAYEEKAPAEPQSMFRMAINHGQ